MMQARTGMSSMNDVLFRCLARIPILASPAPISRKPWNNIFIPPQTMKTSVFALLCLTALSVEGFVPNPHHVSIATCTSPLAMSSNPFESLLGGIMGGKQKEVVEEPLPLPDVVIDPDFKLAGIFLGLGLVLDTIPYIQLVLGPLITVLGILFLVQTIRLKFVFDETAFELKQGNSLSETGENVVVGGANRWTYDSFVNVRRVSG
jgi:hypothetical protein